MNKQEILNYTHKYSSIRKRKIFYITLLICIISFIIGILFLATLDKEGKMVVDTTIKEYLKTTSAISSKNLVFTIKNNILMTIIMWLLGISLFGVIFEILFLIIKSFTLGFSLSSFIYTLKIKGIYIGLIYLIPSIFNLCIYFILGFLAINYSIYLYKYLFKDKDYNLKQLMKKYLKALLISTIFLLISSLFEVYLIPRILKLFTKSLF